MDSVPLPLWAKIALAVIPAISATFAAFGLILNVVQSRRTNAQAKAKLVAESLQGFMNDEDIQEAFYSIEYGEFVYGAEFHGSAQERQIDKLLRHFANLALAWKAGLLTPEDVNPVKYYVLRVLQNHEIRRYLDFVEEWSGKAGLGEHPYVALAQLAARLKK